MYKEEPLEEQIHDARRNLMNSINHQSVEDIQCPLQNNFIDFEGDKHKFT